MSVKTVKKSGVIGAGQMGAGIAQVFAAIQVPVVLVDTDETVLEKGFSTISKSCDRLIKKETLTEEEKKHLLSKITLSMDKGSFSDCDFIVEAVTENLKIKLKIFQELDEITPENTTLCSNTSSLSITKIASVTRNPEQVAGMHFMNPVPLMALVEGIRGLQTSDETFNRLRSVTESLGKVFVEGRDRPGFIVNRILMPMINEAIYALYEGVAGEKAIDLAMKLGTNQPMGPLALADFIGLDTCLAIMNVLHQGFGDSKYRPCPLLVKYVEAGWLGKKSGRGFFDYTDRV